MREKRGRIEQKRLENASSFLTVHHAQLTIGKMICIYNIKTNEKRDPLWLKKFIIARYGGARI